MLLWLAAVPLVLLVDQPLYEAYGRVVGGVVALDWVAQFLTNAVDEKWVALGVIVLLALDRRLRWRFLWDMIMVMLTQSLAGEVLKRLFGRVRPETAHHLAIFRGPDFSHSNYCFPSGHALAAFALAGLLASWYPRWRWAFIAVAICICLARVQLQRHFFADITFGAWVGWYLAAGLTTWRRERSARPPAGAPEPQGE